MAQKIYHHVSWSATIDIWWAQLWRALLANALLYGFTAFAYSWTPASYQAISEALRYNNPMALSLFILFESVVTLWTVRESLTDSYPRFRLVAENKATGKSIFGPGKRIGWSACLSVWWAQFWRMTLLPSAILSGNIAALVATHPNEATYIHMLPPMLVYFCLFLLYVISLWATRESLADRYRPFCFASEPKSFYDDDTIA